MFRILFVLVALIVAALGSIMAASELGGEVVVLRTFEGEGRAFETSLWVVDDGSTQWLRGGNPDSAWVQRLEQNPIVEVERAGKTDRYRAKIVPEQRERVDRMMRERYGFANTIVSVLHDKDEIVVVNLGRTERN